MWFSGHVPMLTQTESAVLQTHSQMQSCSAHGDEVYDHRPSSACMTYVLIHKDPMRVIPNPFSEKFSTLCAGGRLLHSPTVHFSRPLQKSWHWSCNVQAIVYICHRYSMAYNQVK